LDNDYGEIREKIKEGVKQQLKHQKPQVLGRSRWRNLYRWRAYVGIELANVILKLYVKCKEKVAIENQMKEKVAIEKKRKRNQLKKKGWWFMVKSFSF
jgi:hypothetical protein